jgi:hypothetical protein
MNRVVLLASLFLILAVIPAANAGATRPSNGMCAGAWNQTAPPGAARFVVSHDARQGTVAASRVATHSLTFGAGGGSQDTAKMGWACVLTFFTRQQSVSITGTWRNGSVSGWSALHVRRDDGTASGNACVMGDGTLHNVGRFDARSRCA